MNDNPATPDTDPRKPDVSMPKFSSSHQEVLLDRVGREIVKIRKARGMTQTLLARTASVPTNVVFSAENGLHNTSLVTLAKIADALEVDLRDLMPGGSTPAASPVNEVVRSGEQQGRPSVPMLTGVRKSVWKAVALRLFSRRGRP